MLFVIWPYVEKILQPFRILKGKYLGIKAIPERTVGDAKRLKQLGKNVGGQVNAVGNKVTGAGKQAQQMQGQAGQMQGQAPQFGQQAQQWGQPPQMPGYPQMPPQMAAPPQAKKMGLFGKKKACPQCGQPQEKGWDQCPYCLQAAQMAAPPGGYGAPPGAPGYGQQGYGQQGYGQPGYGAAPMGGAAAQKTMAFMAGAAGGVGIQLCGWLVPIKGIQRGELFTLKTQTIIGTDPTQCDIVLTDGYMSSKHATIKAQGGVFVLEDLGSTNGTFVNGSDKRVKTHELVDNDYVTFGQTLCKFKSL